MIGVQLQSVNFFEKLSLFEIVELFATLYSSSIDPNLILDRVDLRKKKDSYFKTLSGGQKQRLSIAVALVNDPKVLFFDEPTTGLHVHDIELLLKVLKRLRDNGNSVVVIEHNMEVIKSADWIIDLGPEGGSEGGQIIATGSPEEITKIKGSHTGKHLKKELKVKS